MCHLISYISSDMFNWFLLYVYNVKIKIKIINTTQKEHILIVCQKKKTFDQNLHALILVETRFDCVFPRLACHIQIN